MGRQLAKTGFFNVTGWPSEMPGDLVMEAGCGAGRFTQVALDTGADVISFDYSNAVDANLQNNGMVPNLLIFQADIYSIPLKQGIFDKIYCFGVLQHTPDVKKAFTHLLPHLKDGGEVAIDVYSRFWFTPLMPKYILRNILGPFIHKMKPGILYGVVSKLVRIILPMTTFLRKIPFLGKYIGHLIPVANYKGVLPLNDEQLKEWSILDTFDTLSPRYDNPQKISDVRNWLTEAGLTDIEVKYGLNGINAKGTKPIKANDN